MSEQLCRHLIPELDPKSWDPTAPNRYIAVCRKQGSQHFGETVYEFWPREARDNSACKNCSAREPL